MPWWAAILIALAATTIGFAFDAGSGNKELSGVFAALYLIGCVAAVIAVRQQSIFTAVVQPPLLLFVAVPSAYYLFHSADIHGIKDILINCGYPLIERFLLMFTTTVIVLVIGMARWYFGPRMQPSAPAEDSTERPALLVAGAGLLVGLKAKISALLAPHRDGERPPRKHAINRSPRATGPRRGERPTRRSAPSRSRHVRPDDDRQPPPPRRRPSRAPYDEAPDYPPRRRAAAPRDPNRRMPPPEYRRGPRERGEPMDRRYEPPARRPGRYDRDLYSDRDLFSDRDAPPPPPPPRRRPTGTSSHHPVSNVRYRGGPVEDDGGRPPRRYDDRRTEA